MWKMFETSLFYFIYALRLGLVVVALHLHIYASSLTYVVLVVGIFAMQYRESHRA